MNNTIEFVLRMRDMMSSNITKVSSTSQSAFNKMSQSANQMKDRNKVLGLSFNELQTKIKQVEDTISKSNIPSQIAAARRELSSLQRMSANHIGNTNNITGGGKSDKGLGIGGVAIGSMIGGLATGAITMGARFIRDGISTMITKSFEKEQAITGLTTFLGKQGAVDAYKNIRTDANATPYDVASLLEVNRALISAGVNAKDARSDTMNLANAVSAVGGGNEILSRMAINMQQIKTVGKATAIDIRQFGIAGINIYEMLARSTGKSIAQVKEMDVTYEELSKSMAMANAKGGIYEGALFAQSQTRSGKWNTLKDNVVSGLSDIGDAFSPIIVKFLDLGIKFANGIEPMLQRAMPYIDGFAEGVGKVVDYFTNIEKTTGGWADYLAIAREHTNNIWEFIKKTAEQVWNIGSSIMDFVKNSELLKDIFSGFVWILKMVFQVIGYGLDLVSWYWENKVKPVLAMIEMVYRFIKTSLGGKIKVEGTFPKMPKTPTNPQDGEPSPLGSGATLMGNNNTSGKAAGDTVSGAGPKVVNITVGKFFDNLTFTTLDGKESATELENIVMECLARVLYNGSKLV